MSARRLRGAIVGYGFIAEKGHLPAYRASQDLEIVAVADTCAARREAAQKALPRARIYEDHRALLAGEAQRIDFVDVTTPPYAHASIARAAMEHKKHVFCEKPLATTVSDARAMLEQAEKSKRVLFPSHNYKHAQVVKAVRDVIDAGRIGEVHMATLTTFRPTHARGVREWNEHWRREKRYSGGGVAMDHGAHTFYLAFEWMKGYPTSISAKMTTRGGFDTEDSMVATATFPTGVVAVHLTWTAGVRKVIYTLHGDRGALRVEDDDLEITAHGAEPERVHVGSAWMDASHATWFESLFKDFASAIDRREYVGREAEDALRCIEVISAAYDSSRDACRDRPIVHLGALGSAA